MTTRKHCGEHTLPVLSYDFILSSITPGIDTLQFYVPLFAVFEVERISISKGTYRKRQQRKTGSDFQFRTLNWQENEFRRKVSAAHNSKTIHGIEMKFGRVLENHKLINVV